MRAETTTTSSRSAAGSCSKASRTCLALPLTAPSVARLWLALPPRNVEGEAHATPQRSDASRNQRRLSWIPLLRLERPANGSTHHGSSGRTDNRHCAWAVFGISVVVTEGHQQARHRPYSRTEHRTAPCLGSATATDLNRGRRAQWDTRRRAAAFPLHQDRMRLDANHTADERLGPDLCRAHAHSATDRDRRGLRRKGACAAQKENECTETSCHDDTHSLPKDMSDPSARTRRSASPSASLGYCGARLTSGPPTCGRVGPSISPLSVQHWSQAASQYAQRSSASTPCSAARVSTY